MPARTIAATAIQKVAAVAGSALVVRSSRAQVITAPAPSPRCSG
jgi:hypothetical protein